ncbi:hypothetical protein N7478_004029 [Penicillium angulare]|uniref:uncharacterized protein n=1 Tax=Penicillium angulare TaxID=116970 RepID=UPI00254053C4|nr:uncharacterized protein N7478_004029 [Penicillium angulare]KAJ5278657.1 hypothetical protein N7478_004029 [Penicillium angulare]
MTLEFLSRLTFNNVFQAVRGLNNTILDDRHVQKTDLQGKWVIISGSNNGVGLEVAKSFASWGANLILACRDPPEELGELHPNAAVEECKRLAEAEHHISTIEWWEIDMADLKTVEAFCERWLKSDRALDILCNNAGLQSAPTTRMTKDGFQIVHQVNFLSHVLLTIRLLPSLGKSTDPRIVCTTSCVHHFGVFDLDHFNGGLEMKGNDYHNNKLYFQMWLTELQIRCLKHPEYAHIRINGVHPGFVASGIWHDDLKRSGISIRALAFLLRYVAITPQQGSLAIINAVTNLECGRDISGGKYFNRVWEAPAHSYCRDEDARCKLWVKLDQVLNLRERGLFDVLGL